MRKLQFIILLSISSLFAGCPPSGRNNELKKLQNNNNDFPDLIKQTHDGISFLLSSMFFDDYNTEYTLQDNSSTFSIYELGLYFTVESFSEREIDVIKFAYEDEMEDLDALHTYYVYKRSESVHSPFVSEKKQLPSSYNLDGYIQVVEGETYDNNPSLDYFIATFKIDKTTYVMQLIGKSENMNYLYDDFLTILRSVN